MTQAASSAHMQYRQAALERERNQGSINSYQAAVFYIHAAWCADDSKAFPQAREYRRLAAESYKRSLSDNTCPQEVRSETEYLIGELMRRAGDFEGARDHFRMCIGRLSARFAVMARKLMRLCEQGSAESIQFEADGLPGEPAHVSTGGGFREHRHQQVQHLSHHRPRHHHLFSAAIHRQVYHQDQPAVRQVTKGGQTGGPPGGPPAGPPGFGGERGTTTRPAYSTSARGHHLWLEVCKSRRAVRFREFVLWVTYNE